MYSIHIGPQNILQGDYTQMYILERVRGNSSQKGESTYYKCSNIGVGSIEQELINIFKHKIYSFYIHL